ncbi:hypothetical protein I553_0727 [Mycobacterium xenopi 4042]|uniref:Uncharacterized protein n=1 Tax=Mycobacterium xenopi 4042 TaxID=1299334 RepID=X7YI13_MYCXE|nr:hypothetical protein I553_0727 [Mycobacterium xenopi 4042]
MRAWRLWRRSVAMRCARSWARVRRRLGIIALRSRSSPAAGRLVAGQGGGGPAQVGKQQRAARVVT